MTAAALTIDGIGVSFPGLKAVDAVSIIVSGGCGRSAMQNFTLTVTPPPLTIIDTA